MLRKGPSCPPALSGAFSQLLLAKGAFALARNLSPSVFPPSRRSPLFCALWAPAQAGAAVFPFVLPHDFRGGSKCPWERPSRPSVALSGALPAAPAEEGPAKGPRSYGRGLGNCPEAAPEVFGSPRLRLRKGGPRLLPKPRNRAPRAVSRLQKPPLRLLPQVPRAPKGAEETPEAAEAPGAAPAASPPPKRGPRGVPVAQKGKRGPPPLPRPPLRHGPMWPVAEGPPWPPPPRRRRCPPWAPRLPPSGAPTPPPEPGTPWARWRARFSPPFIYPQRLPDVWAPKVAPLPPPRLTPPPDRKNPPTRPRGPNRSVNAREVL
ncbi:basic proline-rich protein-like [Penaeus monodon]|uniref:basic proline-rich protein-like n=1 Tax=Penaeus monodon TaxID=6687 RepID=UPI0018A79544|nr:basic proline-rich protein-like [Penaeus monodon]